MCAYSSRVIMSHWRLWARQQWLLWTPCCQALANARFTSVTMARMLQSASGKHCCGLLSLQGTLGRTAIWKNLQYNEQQRESFDTSHTLSSEYLIISSHHPFICHLHVAVFVYLLPPPPPPPPPPFAIVCSVCCSATAGRGRWVQTWSMSQAESASQAR